MKNTAYKSEAMQFINTLLETPNNHEHQMQLRNTWWDKGFIDQEEQKSNHESEVKHTSYVYFSYPATK